MNVRIFKLIRVGKRSHTPGIAESMFVCLLFAFVLTQGWSLAQAQSVKITPLGSRTGDLCAWDVALLFEDPTGVRSAYSTQRR